MVSKKNQVLLAMLSLDSFTVEELSRFSRVTPATVRTVLGRHSHLLEEIGQEETNRRGGRPIRYRLTAAGSEELRRLVQEAEQTLGTHRSRILDAALAVLPLRESQIPLGLRLAEETLERAGGEEADRGKLELLKIAEREARGALRDLDPSDRLLRPRIEKAVENMLARIDRMRRFIEHPEDAPTAWTPFAEIGRQLAPGMGVQIWSGIPVQSGFTRRIARDLQNAVQVYVTEVPKSVNAAAPVGDAVVLIVDSANEKKARTAFDWALQITRATSKPLVVFDKGYDQGFRNHVYGAGIGSYCNDAASLKPDSMRVLVGQALPGSYPEGIRAEGRLLRDAPVAPGLSYKGGQKS